MLGKKIKIYLDNIPIVVVEGHVVFQYIWSKLKICMLDICLIKRTPPSKTLILPILISPLQQKIRYPFQLVVKVEIMYNNTGCPKKTCTNFGPILTILDTTGNTVRVLKETFSLNFHIKVSSERSIVNNLLRISRFSKFFLKSLTFLVQPLLWV